LFTDDDGLADVMRSIRLHGKDRDKYNIVRVGVNGRIDTLQAAILIEKLDSFPTRLPSGRWWRAGARRD
jgi:UDP-2-acetamido-2-deoxy-ribo-hexuluronate aminotransferase